MGSKRALADAALTSESQLFRYISGESEMSSSKAVAFAKAADVDVGWLLTGAGAPDGFRAGEKRPAFRAELMESILRTLTEVLVDFEWRLSPSQRAKYSAYCYMALRHKEMVTGKFVNVTAAEIMEGLWYLGKSTFDELVQIHMDILQEEEAGNVIEARVLSNYAHAIRQGHHQFYNSTGGDAFNRWLGTQVPPATADRLQKLMDYWLEQNPSSLKVLDIGCGNGRELEYIHRIQPDVQVHGTEVSRAALEHCKKMELSGQLPKGAVVEAEATSLPYEDNSMGLVYCRCTPIFLPYFNDPTVNYGLALAMKQMKRVCRPDGFIYFLTPLDVPRSLKYFNNFSKAALRQLFLHNELEIVQEQDLYVENANEYFKNQYVVILKKKG